MSDNQERKQFNMTKEQWDAFHQARELLRKNGFVGIFWNTSDMKQRAWDDYGIELSDDDADGFLDCVDGDDERSISGGWATIDEVMEDEFNRDDDFEKDLEEWAQEDFDERDPD